MEKILIIEDEVDLAEPLKVGLIEEGYDVQTAFEGQTAVRKLNDHWDLIILDLMLPDINGESILDYIKQKPDYPSVLVLTARTGLEDKLSLFRRGCDDYLTKPYIFEELLERVRALLRRSQRVNAPEYRYEDNSLDPTNYRFATRDGAIVLTPKESSILRLMLADPGRVISRKELLHHVWGLKEEPQTNFIGVHLFNLRKKLAEVDRDDWLQTVRSSGFVFTRPYVAAHVS